MNKQPLILIVGKPNVGKSSLFNYFMNRDAAIVSPTMGSTLDNYYGWTLFHNYPCAFIDTAGFHDKHDSELHQQGMKKWSKVIQEADIILFVVDNQTGLNTLDHLILEQLRQHAEVPLICVANKVDHPEDHIHPDIYQLNITPTYHVSGRTRYGLSQLSNVLVEQISQLPPVEGADDSRFRIGFIGKPNAGKSSLINALLDNDHRIVSDIPGTTRDISETPLVINEELFWLTDTAGIRKKKSINDQIEMDSVTKAIKVIKGCPLIVFLIRADIGIADQDKKLLELSAATNQGIIILLTQCDRIQSDYHEHIKQLKEFIKKYAPFTEPISCSIYHPKSIDVIKKVICHTRECLERSFKSSELTQILHMLTEIQEPPRTNVSRIKCNFAHPGKKPRSIIVKGKQVSKMPKSYQKYLLKGFVKHLGLENCHVSLKCVDDENPYT